MKRRENANALDLAIGQERDVGVLLDLVHFRSFDANRAVVGGERLV
jgi:hypothetical protein